MDYNYIRLENQIKALMNQNHVPSSTVSKIAESLKNGILEMYIDNVQNRFVFKYLGINNPVFIDPLKKEILNVELLNGVSVANLVGGIQNGYGINIEETAKGVFKISVDETMVASKADLSKVETKFNDYTTTVDLEANYATKSDLNDVDSKLGDYATKTELNSVDAKFNNYTTTAELEANDMKKEDVIPPSESQFDTVNGYPEYYIKNEHVLTTTLPGINYLSTSEFNVLSITIPSEIKEQIYAVPDNVNFLNSSFAKKYYTIKMANYSENSMPIE